VHQGDRPGGGPGAKGVYHINAVGQVTQWEIVSATPAISETCLPVLAAILRQFPFRIKGFHSDNGSEFINAPVAKLLNKLLIEHTKAGPCSPATTAWSKPRTEPSSASTSASATSGPRTPSPSSASTRSTSTPISTSTGPAPRPTPRSIARGRIRRSYKRYQTTFEMLLALDQPAQYLRDGLELATLNRNAGALSDTDAARRMQQAKATLFDRLRLAG
jgi:hypothetical protein